MIRPGLHLDGITTFVGVMLGRASYDRVLGARSLVEHLPGDGLSAGMSNPNRDGDHIAVYQAFEPRPAAPPTGLEAARRQSNGGRNDGFVIAHQEAHAGRAETEPMSYLVRSQLPVTWALADAYASCDRWFASHDGVAWWESFERAGVPWRLYQTQGLPWFLELASTGTLPPVSLIDLTTCADRAAGEELLRMVYDAVATSTHWAHSLVVISCTDHGGFFDHVPRPGLSGGFRVPAIVVGPYVRSAHVSSQPRDHQRFARELAESLATGALPATADCPLADCLDLARLRARQPAAPIALPGADARPTPRRRQRITAQATGRHDGLASFQQ